MDINTESNFVLRRAFLIGKCKRSDIDKAFGTGRSPARASQILKHAVSPSVYGQFIYQAGKRGVFPRSNVKTPTNASAETILDLIANRAGPTITGLFEDEASFLLPPTNVPKAINSFATQKLLEILIKKEPISILYVGLRREENAKWRDIYPRAMEFTGTQWRIHAQDINDNGKLKAYVLSRISDTRPLGKRHIQDGFHALEMVKEKQKMRIHLADAFTADQTAAIINEFGISGNVMYWPHSSAYEFKKQYSKEPPNEAIVWPVFSKIEFIE